MPSSGRTAPSLIRLELQLMTYTRCAVHFGSGVARSKDDPLYQSLLHTEVFTSEQIVKTTCLYLNGDVLATQSSRGTFHLHEDRNLLRLYVPSGRRCRELCYITQVPKRLALLFSATGAIAEKTLGDVLRASVAILDDVLSSQGIVKVSGVKPTSEVATPLLHPESPTSISNEEASDSSEDTTARVEESTAAEDTDLGFERDTATIRGSNMHAGGSIFGTRFRVESTDRPPVPVAPPRSHEYAALLDQVIKAAGRIKFPRLRATTRASFEDLVSPSLSPEHIFGSRAENPLDHDIKVGAAGELFVS